MNRIQALIVDDEPLARERVKRFLSSEPDIEVGGECANGREAVEAILKHNPDLVFLDIQIPELDGFEVLTEVSIEQPLPAVIFITAYDRYALQAFDVNALDYLLKPYNRERFNKALERARAQLVNKETVAIDERVLSLLQNLKNEPTYLERLIIKSSGRVFFLRTDEIDWIEAEGNYLRLHVGKETHLLRETMNRLESKLDPNRFLRIHRSTLVNIERIKELQPLFSGDYTVILRNNTHLTLSRSYHTKLQQLFAKFS